MNITRNNYEEYFLLYIDNELDNTEREAVDRFLNENPDLQMELDALKATVFTSVDITFPQKELLLKDEMSSQIQEQLLLHLDNELNSLEKKAFEKTIASDKTLQQEFILLKQTKLDATQKIVFPDKSILYRRTKGRVVAFDFRKFAAAAIILGVLFSAGYLVLNNKGANDNPSINVAVVKKNNSINNSVANNTTNQHTTIQDNNNITVPAANKAMDDSQNLVVNNQSLAAVVKHNKTNAVLPVNDQKINVVKNIDDQSNKNDQVAVQQSNKPLNNNQKINTPDRIETPESLNPLMATNNNIKPEMKPELIVDRDMTQKDNSNVALASFSDNNEDKVLYMDEEKVSKSKFAGFIKKVKRTVERNAKIKTNGLRIGGFDIALK